MKFGVIGQLCILIKLVKFYSHRPINDVTMEGQSSRLKGWSFIAKKLRILAILRRLLHTYRTFSWKINLTAATIITN